MHLFSIFLIIPTIVSLDKRVTYSESVTAQPSFIAINYPREYLKIGVRFLPNSNLEVNMNTLYKYANTYFDNFDDPNFKFITVDDEEFLIYRLRVVTNDPSLTHFSDGYNDHEVISYKNYPTLDLKIAKVTRDSAAKSIAFDFFTEGLNSPQKLSCSFYTDAESQDAIKKEFTISRTFTDEPTERSIDVKIGKQGKEYATAGITISLNKIEVNLVQLYEYSQNNPDEFKELFGLSGTTKGDIKVPYQYDIYGKYLIENSAGTEIKDGHESYEEESFKIAYFSEENGQIILEPSTSSNETISKTVLNITESKDPYQFISLSQTVQIEFIEPKLATSKMNTREEGPAQGIASDADKTPDDDPFDYSKAYKDVGMTFDEGVITVDRLKAMEYVENPDNHLHFKYLCKNIKNVNYLFYGIQFTAPEGMEEYSQRSEINFHPLNKDSDVVFNQKAIEYFGALQISIAEDGSFIFDKALEKTLSYTLLWRKTKNVVDGKTTYEYAETTNTISVKLLDIFEQHTPKLTRLYGPAEGLSEDKIEEFDYQKAYTKAGIEYADNKISVNYTQLFEYANNKLTQSEFLKLCANDGGIYTLFVGFDIPVDSEKYKYIMLGRILGDNSFEETAFVPLADKKDGPKYYQNQVMKYIKIAEFYYLPKDEENKEIYILENVREIPTYKYIWRTDKKEDGTYEYLNYSLSLEIESITTIPMDTSFIDLDETGVEINSNGISVTLQTLNEYLSDRTPSTSISSTRISLVRTEQEQVNDVGILITYQTLETELGGTPITYNAFSRFATDANIINFDSDLYNIVDSNFYVLNNHLRQFVKIAELHINNDKRTIRPYNQPTEEITLSFTNLTDIRAGKRYGKIPKLEISNKPTCTIGQDNCKECDQYLMTCKTCNDGYIRDSSGKCVKKSADNAGEINDDDLYDSISDTCTDCKLEEIVKGKEYVELSLSGSVEISGDMSSTQYIKANGVTLKPADNTNLNIKLDAESTNCKVSLPVKDETSTLTLKIKQSTGTDNSIEFDTKAENLVLTTKTAEENLIVGKLTLKVPNTVKSVYLDNAKLLKQGNIALQSENAELTIGTLSAEEGCKVTIGSATKVQKELTIPSSSTLTSTKPLTFDPESKLTFKLFASNSDNVLIEGDLPGEPPKTLKLEKIAETGKVLDENYINLTLISGTNFKCSAWKGRIENIQDTIYKTSVCEPIATSSTLEETDSGNYQLILSTDPTLKDKDDQPAGPNDGNGGPGNDDDPLSPGAIAGIVIACIVVVAAVVVVLVYFLVIKKKNDGSVGEQQDVEL